MFMNLIAESQRSLFNSNDQLELKVPKFLTPWIIMLILNTLNLLLNNYPRSNLRGITLDSKSKFKASFGELYTAEINNFNYVNQQKVRGYVEIATTGCHPKYSFKPIQAINKRCIHASWTTLSQSTKCFSFI